MKIKLCVALLMALFAGMFASAQKVALKTNLLYDATATVNAGIEIGLAPRWTLDISGNFNDWIMSHNRKWKHWLVQPEARYWFCERFSGHFIGIHAHGGEYNFGNLKNGIKFLGSDFSKLTDNRYQGCYAWILGKHWNLEAELGIGYIYTRFDKYPCAECGEKIEEDASHHYFGPTKLALSIVYLF